MKKIILLLTFGLSLLAFAVTSKAALVTGFVLCDANQNLMIDTNDVGIPGVLVVVTNQSASFSNSVVTAADGSFSLTIPDFDPLAERLDPLSQVYVETLDAASLPPDSAILIPLAITNLISTPAYFIDFAADLTNVVYTSATGTSNTGNWLINNPDCQSGGCRLKGEGSIRSGNRKKPGDTFGGKVFSDDSATPDRKNEWMDISHDLRLHFRSTLVQVVSCGEISGVPPGSNGPVTPFRVIDFGGTGTLKGTDGNRANFNPVFFTARVEDHGRPGKGADRYYLRVFTADGTTRLLVSGDPANPTDIVTVPISEGNLRIDPR